MPRLDDSLVRSELNEASRNLPAEALESATTLAVDQGGNAGKRAELLGVGQSCVHLLRARLEINFLMDRFGHCDCSCLSKFVLD
jgi:hypothetical protein